jgi:hypothetical protein
MVGKGLIVREKLPSKRRGRPSYLYRASAEALASASGAPGGVVALEFGDLRCLCRYRRGGRCRETRDECGLEFFPQIMRRDGTPLKTK